MVMIRIALEDLRGSLLRSRVGMAGDSKHRWKRIHRAAIRKY